MSAVAPSLAGVLASIPSPSFNSISIGPIELRMYGLMIALGVIAAVWLLGKQLEAHHLGTTDDAGSIAVWGVVAGVIGARLYHVATDWSRFSDNLGAIPKIWEGGLGIPGGLIAGIAAGVYQAKRRGIRPGVVMTFAAPAIALAQSIGRWGNWFNQELYGKPTDLPWALEIDDEHLEPGYPSGTTFHPTFLYESLWNLALCVVLLRIQARYRLAPGRLMAVYAIGYGAGRFWIEGLRIDEATEVGGLRWNQWMALAAIAVGVVALVLTRGRTWDVVPGRDGDDGATLAPSPVTVDETDETGVTGDEAGDDAGDVGVSGGAPDTAEVGVGDGDGDGDGG